MECNSTGIYETEWPNIIEGIHHMLVKSKENAMSCA